METSWPQPDFKTIPDASHKSTLVMEAGYG
jgi:hypothetical protein